MSQNLKISGLTAISTFAAGDLLEIVDISDTTMAPTGTNKKSSLTQISAYLATVIGGGTATAVTVANEASDTTCFPLFVTAATGDLGPKSQSALKFNSSTGELSSTTIKAGSGIILKENGLYFGSDIALLLELVDSPENYIRILSAEVDVAPSITSLGVATDIDLSIATQGAGSVRIDANTGGTYTITGPTQARTITVPDADFAVATTTTALLLTGGTMAGNITFNDTGEGIALHSGGSVTGASGGVTIAASGTNQNVAITPSGTGRVLIPSTSSSTSPILAFGNTATGISGFADQLWTTLNTVLVSRISSVGIELRSASGITFSTSSVSSGIDAGISRNAAGVVEINSGTPGTLRDLTLRSITASGTVKPGAYTFATLPTPATGMVAYITDCNTATYNATAAAGGANVVKVFYNGTNWVVA